MPALNSSHVPDVNQNEDHHCDLDFHRTKLKLEI